MIGLLGAKIWVENRVSFADPINLIPLAAGIIAGIGNLAINFTSTFSNGITTQFVNTDLRPLSALFGPKFQAGTSGPFRAFVTGKLGFVNFSTSNQSALAGFKGSLGAVTSGNTRFAIYPGAGVEAFWGPFGLRLDAGDAIYFDNGAQNNINVEFGPHLRF